MILQTKQAQRAAGGLPFRQARPLYLYRENTTTRRLAAGLIRSLEDDTTPLCLMTEPEHY
jgi:hypothetical protein